MSDASSAPGHTATDVDWDEVRRTGQRVHPLTPIVRGLVVVVAIAGAVVNGLLSRTFELSALWQALILGAVLVGGFVAGFMSWRHTAYLLDDGAFRLRSGWLVRSRRSLAYRMIQSATIAQPLVARLLGLASVQLNVTGSMLGLTVAYLRRADAERLRDDLLQRARTSGAPVGEAPADRRDDAYPADDEPAPDEWVDDESAGLELVRHSPARVIGAGLISTALLFSVLGVTAAAIDIFVISGDGPSVRTFIALIGGFGPLATFVATYWGLRVSTSSAGLRVSRGLTALQHDLIAPGKVQGVQLSRPVLWRLRGLVKIELVVASGLRAAPVVVLAAGTAAEARALMSRLDPSFDVEGAAITPAARRARYARPVGWRRLRYGATADALVVRRGWLTERTTIVRHSSIEAMWLRRGPWQRLLGLASVEVATAFTRVTIAHLALTDAQQLVRTELTALYRTRRESSLADDRDPGLGKLLQ
ncbi:PH domain-containing protein [Epidermidibacterium keratini]|uniref:PH domain-containing protein n=1 Tax=Epidermidibacterium keratini TaxID=1891644 RepID=A0A7L4YKZ8_9ACTN|nr:PH domain-containing protein [Epidermidibacterium keratini]QHB99513.1 PH domain-containing protein [Epidermidibacterium keratini]